MEGLISVLHLSYRLSLRTESRHKYGGHVTVEQGQAGSGGPREECEHLHQCVRREGDCGTLMMVNHLC